ncbi:beta-ketoacyl synthase chain length factor [Pseudomonas fontis]|uniref:Beta-ketoacyl synthase chain length factor n=1 Tax=Pseudomonas fontis TaxID=2942633 RepID=A0ABT5NS29_9PSED|nr:beta-ketoacyl synthase chain length factor [Pseudomonas fontis]MDD0973679.1 beta-ketoacyl synthase chain length factor [Pseudomonas fontis]MDD0990976.1 beta-ketoacyl synthase chain length factor [Pseudomonas fontis]
MITFNIRQWRAWAPGLESAADWQGWSTDARLPAQGDLAPDVSFLPALQRRRLSRLARMAFSVGWPLAEGLGDLPLVFVSRHGETPRTFDILSDLAAEQPLSPTQFSLSVHNAVIGMWSIMRGETSEMTALAAAGDGFEQGLLEAATLLHEGAPAVLLIISEEQPPAAYRPTIDDVPFPYALGLLLEPGNNWQLALGESHAAAEPAAHPHALNWLRHLLLGHTSFHHTWNQRTWNWQRH